MRSVVPAYFYPSLHPLQHGTGGNSQYEGMTKGQSVTFRMAAVSLSNGHGRGGAEAELPKRRQPAPASGPPAGWQSRGTAGGSRVQSQSQAFTTNTNVKNAQVQQQQQQPQLQQQSQHQRDCERDWEMVNLDDLPPSLRKSPVSASASKRVPVPRIQTTDVSVHSHHSQQPKTPPALLPCQWTPSSPTAAMTTAPKPTYPTNHNHNHTHNPNCNYPHVPKVESPVPVGGRDSRPDIPKISFPDNGEEDEDDVGGGFGGGLSIMVSGPDESGPAPPRIAVSAPQISVSVPGDGPTSSRS
jgi:hypothetical protein